MAPVSLGAVLRGAVEQTARSHEAGIPYSRAPRSGTKRVNDCQEPGDTYKCAMRVQFQFKHCNFEVNKLGMMIFNLLLFCIGTLSYVVAQSGTSEGYQNVTYFVNWYVNWPYPLTGN